MPLTIAAFGVLSYQEHWKIQNFNLNLNHRYSGAALHFYTP